MRRLTPSDEFHVQAAEGWLELGSLLEAVKELEHLPTELDLHPAILELRWKIHAAEKR